MTIKKVLRAPHPILRELCEPVQHWDGALQQLVDDMTDTLYAAHGAVGLAACQIGETARVLVLDVSSKTTREAYKVLINPVILESSRNKTMREGCLSFPDYLASIKRATKVTFSAFDRDGGSHIYTVQGLEAIAIQHEIDHLDGILMIDRINSLKTDWIRRQPRPGDGEDLAVSGNTGFETDEQSPNTQPDVSLILNEQNSV